MQQPVLIDLLGLQCFAGAYGLFMMFNGVASLSCQPFSGMTPRLTFDATDFSVPFRQISIDELVYRIYDMRSTRK